MDTNNVTISNTSSYSISGITYIANSLVVTAGQDHAKAPTINQSGSNEWTITLLADRQNSSPVADSFNGVGGGPGHEAAEEMGWDSTPTKLNFYFGLNLTVEVVGGNETIPVYLGQGHTGLNNNWWFGGGNALVWVNEAQGWMLTIGGTQFQLAYNTSTFWLATSWLYGY